MGRTLPPEKGHRRLFAGRGKGSSLWSCGDLNPGELMKGPSREVGAVSSIALTLTLLLTKYEYFPVHRITTHDRISPLFFASSFLRRWCAR
jgi:hypothetical protein